uniref:Uncharacterized protein n=1 Tax=Salix viminalis TaxID=40686 RepID=A0A6N2LLN3_SALVM
MHGKLWGPKHNQQINLIVLDYQSFCSSSYGCEDASSYYAILTGLKGKALKKKLHSISVTYCLKQVWLKCFSVNLRETNTMENAMRNQSDF